MILNKVIEAKRPKMNGDTESRPRESVIINLKNVTGFGNGLIFENDSEVENSNEYFELGKYQDFILELDHPNLFDNVKLQASRSKSVWHQNWLEPTGEFQQFLRETSYLLNRSIMNNYFRDEWQVPLSNMFESFSQTK